MAAVRRIGAAERLSRTARRRAPDAVGPADSPRAAAVPVFAAGEERASEERRSPVARVKCGVPLTAVFNVANNGMGDAVRPLVTGWRVNVFGTQATKRSGGWMRAYVY